MPWLHLESDIYDEFETTCPTAHTPIRLLRKRQRGVASYQRSKPNWQAYFEAREKARALEFRTWIIKRQASNGVTKRRATIATKAAKCKGY